MTYDDAPLEHTSSEIKKLLNHGYPVVVHVNHGMGNMFESDGLLLHKALLEILEWDIDMYFLTMDGYENKRYSTLLNGTLISCLMQTKEKVFETAIPDTKEEKLRCISEFFGFSYYSLLPD